MVHRARVYVCACVRACVLNRLAENGKPAEREWRKGKGKKECKAEWKGKEIRIGFGGIFATAALL